MEIQTKTRIKQWGNSLGIIIPNEIVIKEDLQPQDEVIVTINKKKDNNLLKEIFGTHKFKKPVEQIMKEVDEELYNE